VIPSQRSTLESLPVLFGGIFVLGKWKRCASLEQICIKTVLTLMIIFRSSSNLPQSRPVWINFILVKLHLKYSYSSAVSIYIPINFEKWKNDNQYISKITNKIEFKKLSVN
jgi:hypothetical protein